MAFGRRKKDRDSGVSEDAETAVRGEVEEAGSSNDEADDEFAAADAVIFEGDFEGPFDIEDFANPEEALLARLDLGSVLVPMPPGGQIQVELNQQGVPSAIWVVTPNGRFTVAAYAAPKSPGLWREVAGELAEALRNDNASVSIEDGPWGREVVGTGAGVVRFIGVDGYRWMVRCVVNGAPHTMAALAAEARTALADSVVRRGDTPMPVRTPLPVELPEELAAQLRAAAEQQAQQAQQAMLAAQQQQALFAQQQQAMFAQQQQFAQQQFAQQEQASEQAQVPTERRAADGSAMQQLRGTGG